MKELNNLITELKRQIEGLIEDCAPSYIVDNMQNLLIMAENAKRDLTT